MNQKPRITYSLPRPGCLYTLLFDAKNTEDIFLASENSMIDTERIDTIDNGLMKPQSVNLEKNSGNKYILNTLNQLKRINGLLFPGTLIEDVGGYFHPTMPVIKDGEIIHNRRKIFPPLFDKIVDAARKVLGEDKAKELEITARKNLLKCFFEEPFKTPYNAIIKRSLEESINSLKPIEHEDYLILPVICNEMPSIPRYYKGKPVNLILHSCCEYFDSNERRLKYYKRVLPEFIEKNVVETPFYLNIAETGKNSHAGMYRVNKAVEIKKI